MNMVNLENCVMDSTTIAPLPTRLDSKEIEARLKKCARLPSLGTINSALRELLASDQTYIAQISEVIRRDPSLTSRLLRLVNSVFFGLSTPVNSIEEAVFYLGVRQIRQLAMLTPVIEDFQKLAGKTEFPWKEFWQHCIGTAIMTREVVSTMRVPSDEADYVSGLVHDVGRIAMAATFPDHFHAIINASQESERSINEIEIEILGIDHANLGADYLREHNLPEALEETARFHHCPERASRNIPIVAAVSLADRMVRLADVGTDGEQGADATEPWWESTPWHILFPNQSEEEFAMTKASLERNLNRLPTIVEGLV